MEWQKVLGSTKDEWFLVDNNNNPLVHIGYNWYEDKKFPYTIYKQKPLSFLFQSGIKFANIYVCKTYAENVVKNWINSFSE